MAMKRLVCKEGGRMGGTSRSSPQQARKGSAQVELALFLPLYASVLMLLPTLSNFARTHQSVVINARHQAWVKQSSIGDKTETLAGNKSNLALPGRILLGQQEPSAGVISGRDEKQATVYLKALDVAVDAQSEHFAFTDPWDYRVLRFEDAASHPRLTMGERVLFAGDIDREAFAALATTAGAASPRSTAQLAEIARQRNQAIEKAKRAVAELTKSIDIAKDKVAQIEKDLSTARNQFPVDFAEVDSLTAALKSARQKLEELKANMQKLQAAKELLGLY